MRFDPGFVLRWLFERYIRTVIVGVKPPVVIHWQTGSIKGRIIVDTW